MNKNFVIEELEKALKKQEEIVEHEIVSIKSMQDEIAETEKEIVSAQAQIASLKDAIHKLKGLDNLEKKNKIAGPAGFVVKDVTGFDIHKFARELILPDIIEYLKSSRISFISGGKLK